MLVTALLPSRIILQTPNPTQLDLGGRGQHAALIYPVSHRSPILKIEKGLRRYISNAIHSNMGDINIKPNLQRQIDEIVEECMGRLRVIKLKARNKNWALALRALQLSPPHSPPRVQPGYSRSEGKGNGRDEEREGGLDLVVCDGFSDGFYHDRSSDEHQHRLSRKKVGVRGGEDVGMGDVIRAIDGLREGMGSVVVLSIQGLWVRLFLSFLPFLTLPPLLPLLKSFRVGPIAFTPSPPGTSD